MSPGAFSQAGQRDGTKIPNSQKKTGQDIPGMPDTGQQTFCRVLLGLLWQLVLEPLPLCPSALFYVFACEPNL